MKTRLNISMLLFTMVLLSCGKSSKITPQRKDLTEMVFASGTLVADDQYNLTARTDGYLVKVNFNEGDMVNKDQMLAAIDNDQNVYNEKGADALHIIAESNTQTNAPALRMIEANIEAAKAKLALDQQQEIRYKRLYENNSVSKNEYENIQLTAVNSKSALEGLQQQYNTQLVAAQQLEVAQRYQKSVNRVVSDQNVIRAVTAGRIYEKKKQLGDYVKAGDVIAVIGNPHLIYAELDVDETNMSKLKLGQETFVELNTHKGKIYKARVHEILPAFEASTQSFIIKAYFTDSLDFRIAGTQLEANIKVGEKKNALVIPRNYLGYGDMVILKKGKKIMPVKTGIVSTEWAEILGGIDEHDELIPDENK
jgi:multidrug efflux pump subunit AcrA (membrane-fusion protein)